MSKEYRQLTILFAFVACFMAFLLSYNVQNADATTAAELHASQTKFVTCVTSTGKEATINYYTELETNKHYVEVQLDGERLWRVSVEQTGMNKAYFQAWKYNQANNVYPTTLWYWSGSAWLNAGDLFSLDPGENDVSLLVPPEDEYIKDRLRITIPSQNGTQTRYSYKSIWVQYCIPTPSGGSDEILIDIEGGTSRSLESFQEWEKDGYTYGEFNFHQGLNVGNNNITVTATADGKQYTDTRLIIRKAGHVDEDGDGIDDITFEPVWPENPNDWDENGPPEQPGEDATIFDYIKWFADSILWTMGQMVTMIKGFIGGIGQVGNIMSEIFKFMPPEFTTIIVLGLIVTLVMRVVGR